MHNEKRYIAIKEISTWHTYNDEVELPSGCSTWIYNVLLDGQVKAFRFFIDKYGDTRIDLNSCVRIDGEMYQSNDDALLLQHPDKQIYCCVHERTEVVAVSYAVKTDDKPDFVEQESCCNKHSELIECTKCGHLMHVEYAALYHANDGSLLCSGCVKDYLLNECIYGSDLCNKYHEPYVVTGSKNIGLELEYESSKAITRNDMNELQSELEQCCAANGLDKNFIRATHEPSLDSYGMEFVTAPFQWKWLSSNWCVVEQLLKIIWKYGFDVTKQRTGLHIHFSRDWLDYVAEDECQFYSLARCSVLNRELIEVVGRRTNCSHAKFLEYDEAKTEKNSAVNFLHADTIEFRSFKSTTDFDDIKDAINVCRCLIEESRRNKYGER